MFCEVTAALLTVIVLVATAGLKFVESVGRKVTPSV